MTRTCRKCGAEKDSGMFVKNKRCKSGYSGLCKECDRARQRERSARIAASASKIKKFPPFKGYGLPEWRSA